MIEKGEKKEVAVMQTIQKYIVESKQYCLKVMATAKNGQRKQQSVVYRILKLHL